MNAPLRVLVTSWRLYQDETNVRSQLDSVLQSIPSWEYRSASGEILLVVIEGACSAGGDAYAARWAADNYDNGVRSERHHAEWRTLGKAAGPRRNQLMVERGADLCLAFLGEPSVGGRHCAGLALKARIPLRTFEVAA